MKKNLPLIVIQFTLLVILSNCQSVSTQTTNYLQNGDRLANENNLAAAKSEYLQYLKLGAKLGIYRNEPLEAETHRKLAYVYSAEGNYDSSIIQLNFALAKDLKFPDNQSQITSDLTELALLKAYQGKYQEALSEIDHHINQKLVSIRKNPDRQAYANLLLAKARIEFALGEYRACEKALFECIRIIEPTDFQVEKAEVKYLLSIIHQDQGNFTGSALELAEAISILKKSGLNCALQLHTQGDQQFLQGHLESGITKHVEALKEAESSNILPLIIRSHTQLGEAYEFIGNRKQADFHFLKAIELQKQLIKIGYIDSPLPKKGDAALLLNRYEQTGQKSGIAKASVAMAEEFKSKGQLDSSLHYLNEAYTFYARSLQAIQRRNVELKMLDVVLDKRDLDSATSLLTALKLDDMPQTYELPYLQGRFEALAGNTEKAKSYLRNALDIIEANRSGISIPALRSNYLGTKNYVYQEMIDVLLNPTSNTYSNIMEAYDWNERARSRSFLDLIAAKNISPLQPEHKGMLDREQSIRLKLIKLNDEINKNQLSAELAQVYQKTKTHYNALTDSIASLDPRYSQLLTSNVSSLKEIRKALRPDEILIEYWIGTHQSYVWHASKDTVGLIILDFKESDLDRDVNAFRNFIKFKVQDQTNELGQKLYASLLAPIPKLNSFKHLIIIPHRSQAFIPFEALQAQNGKYLIQAHTLSYAPSGTIFLAKRRSNVEKTGKMLAMALGDETYGSYVALPGTEVEVQNIAKHFNPTQVKVGLASTESTLKSVHVDFNLIHLATHGVLNKKNPLQSYIALNSDSLNDGQLTVSEIFDLQLSSALTTLSACETALGEVNRGNELIGLSTAFLYCGSKAVIVSLWKVDDEATALLMNSFYEELSKGLPISESMAVAQRKIMSIPEYSGNPFYWSPFVIIGEGHLASY